LQKVPVDPLHLLKQITGSLPYHKIPVTRRHVNQPPQIDIIIK
jgi:hypothetical protein